ncbi:EscU/YscU/HrcU family type III secretion system export apparatus switch protein [candidate division WOR-3 bacterium]|nr:EscU/YscU/HrcU family type III secretion system export apparatus switch protein [candidate division WOR-3 bacterium]
MKNKKATALQYKSKKDKAPKVIAKGRGRVADEILKIARKHNIPIQENEELVSALLMLDIGEFIPEELYPVVAKILAFIYTLDKKAAEFYKSQ